MKIYNMLYKSLPKNMKPHGFKYPVNKWVKCEKPLNICNVGFHCSENIIDAMNYVPAEVLARVEVRGVSIIQDDKQCWSEMRIDKIYKWTKKDSVGLAIFAAELVLKNYEDRYPGDLRPRQAIEAAKAVLKKDNKKNRNAAESAAWSAAWSAAKGEILFKCHNWVLERAGFN